MKKFNMLLRLAGVGLMIYGLFSSEPNAIKQMIAGSTMWILMSLYEFNLTLKDD